MAGDTHDIVDSSTKRWVKGEKKLVGGELLSLFKLIQPADQAANQEHAVLSLVTRCMFIREESLGRGRTARRDWHIPAVDSGDGNRARWVELRRVSAQSSGFGCTLYSVHLVVCIDSIGLDPRLHQSSTMLRMFWIAPVGRVGSISPRHHLSSEVPHAVRVDAMDGVVLRQGRPR